MTIIKNLREGVTKNSYIESDSCDSLYCSVYYWQRNWSQSKTEAIASGSCFYVWPFSHIYV